jgi:hypothetical protein
VPTAVALAAAEEYHHQRHGPAKTIMLVCSVFARMPRYHLSALGTTRQEYEAKSAQSGTNWH